MPRYVIALNRTITSIKNKKMVYFSSTTSKNRRNLSQTALARNMPREEIHKRYSLWARDFSSLYSVVKLPSHQFPI